LKKIISILTLGLVCLALSLMFSTKAKAQGSASFSLSPSSGTITSQNFDVNVMINTGGSGTDGSDIQIKYDPNFLDVVDQNSSVSGVQIKTGSLYPTYLGNSVDETNGIIRLSGISQVGGIPYNGSGVFATITFKGHAQTSATAVQFNYQPGRTDDNTNIMQTGTNQEILGSVSDGSYAVSVTGCTPNCTGKACGDNGCGGSCGTCQSGSTCQGSTCVISGGTTNPPGSIGDFISRAISSGMTVPLILVIALVVLAGLSLYFLLKKKK